MSQQTIPGADEVDERYIKKLGVVVTMAGSSYVVRDPTRGKRGVKFEGGNLHALLLKCERERNEAAAAKPSTSTRKKPASAPVKAEGENSIAPGSAEQHQDAEHQPEAGKLPGLTGRANGSTSAPEAQSSGGSSIGEAVADGKRRKAASASQKSAEDKKGISNAPRVATGKRSPGDWKTYQVGRLILTNPDLDAEGILAKCREDGIETKIMTVVGLMRYFNLCVRLLTDLSKEQKAAT